MSSIYQPKRKELAKVKVVSSQTYKNNRSKYKLVGSVNRGYDCFITTQRILKMSFQKPQLIILCLKANILLIIKKLKNIVY